MSISHEKLDSFVRTAVEAYELTGETGWSMPAPKAYHVDQVLGVLVRQVEKELTERCYSEAYLKIRLNSVILPEMRRNNEISWSNCKRRIMRQISTNKPLTIEHFVFPINVIPPQWYCQRNSHSFRLDNKQILWLSHLTFCDSNYYNKEVAEYFEKYYRTTNTFYEGSFVVIKIRARDSQFAADKAYYQLRCFLGLLKLTRHYNKVSYSLMRSTSSTISTVSGSPHFFHYKKRMTFSGRWTTNDLVPSTEVRFDSHDFKRLEAFYDLVKLITKRHDIHKTLLSFLAMYSTALSTPIKENAFLLLWGICEMLTFLPRSNKYKTMLKRIRGIYPTDRDLFHTRLELFRIKRNNLVHELELNVGEEDLDFIKSVAESLFMFIINNSNFYNAREKIVFIMENSTKGNQRLKSDAYLIKTILRWNKRE